MNYYITKGVKKGTIVFIHGSSSSSTMFLEILKAKGIQNTKIAIDLPGHGNSNKEYNDIDSFGIAYYSKKVIDFINNIADDILLVGNSFGGNLSIEIANSIKRLKGLVIMGTAPLKKPINFEEAFLPTTALQTFFTENPNEVEITKAAEIAVFNKDFSEIIVNDFRETNPKARKNIAEDFFGGKLSNEYQLFLELPIYKCIIAGKQDPSVNSKYLEDIVSNCVCDYHVFDNCGHYPSLEKPKEFEILIKQIAQSFL